MPTLEWIGKEKVINHDKEVPFKLLDARYTFDANGKREGASDSDNMIIHGDNLLALKALLPKYQGKIKCIYIDPPYNTAKSSEKNKAWFYSDNVDDPIIKKWLNEAVGDEGEDLTRHDKWLCMMYPRLKLLHALLSQDGIIFISIDDNEVSSLRFICDEIFGKTNFISQLVWKSDGNFDNQAKIKICHEYILCYSKNQSILGFPNGIDPNASENSKIFNSEIRNTVVKNGSKNPMSVITLPKGFPCAVDTMEIQEHYDSFPHYHSKAIIKNGRLQNNVNVESGWSSKNILLAFINNKFEPVLDTKQQLTTFEITHTGAIEMIKQREHKSHVLSVLSNLGSTQNMSNELARMNIKFDFPKPLELLKYLIGFYAENHDIILDSFAGSGTTAHAVLSLNKKDNGNRKFILVEMMDYAESITAERVKRVIDGYGEGNKVVPGTGGSFTFYELGEKLFNDDGNLNAAVPAEKIREYVWYMETKRPLPVPRRETENNLENETESAVANQNGDKTDRNIEQDNKAFFGVSNHTAYYFYYNPESATTLDHDFLSTIKTKAESYVIYADACALGEGFLTKHHITFKKIPRDIERL